METKKNIFGRIKDWWNELDKYTKEWLVVVGIWTVDGVMIGSAVTSAVKNKQMKKLVDQSIAAGYIQGKMDTYQEMLQNPYRMMDAGMKRLEQQGKAKHF